MLPPIEKIEIPFAPSRLVTPPTPSDAAPTAIGVLGSLTSIRATLSSSKLATAAYVLAPVAKLETPLAPPSLVKPELVEAAPTATGTLGTLTSMSWTPLDK